MRSSSIRAGSKSNDKGPCKRQKREDTGRDGTCGHKPRNASRRQPQEEEKETPPLTASRGT